MTAITQARPWRGVIEEYRERLPVTEAIGERELTLPLHPLLDPADVDLVAYTLRAALEAGSPDADDRSAHGTD